MSLEEQQLQMLRRMATLDPPPCFMGGYAEDALLAGTLTRPHEDFDWLLPRRELELRTAQAKRLGFSGFETWGEAAPSEPFYLYAENGGLKLDLGIADEERSSPWIKVHRLSFTVDGKEAPAGYRRSRAGSRGISTTPMIAGVIWGVLIVGPPGAGKSLAARRLPSILPSLSSQEALEVLRIFGRGTD